MKIENLKWLKKEQIEEKATIVLTRFRADYFTQVRPTPLEEIVTFLVENGNVKFDNVANLGFAGNNRILGCYVPSTRTIRTDIALQANPTKYKFVLGHEFGHFVLHWKVAISEAETDILEDTDQSANEGKVEYKDGKRTFKNDFDRMEWQANYFASAILLPNQVFRRVLARIHDQMGLEWRKFVYVDRQPCNLNEYNAILLQLSDYFGVSKTVVEIRLRELKLLKDNRDEYVNAVANRMANSLDGVISKMTIRNSNELEPPF